MSIQERTINQGMRKKKVNSLCLTKTIQGSLYVCDWVCVYVCGPAILTPMLELYDKAKVMRYVQERVLKFQHISEIFFSQIDAFVCGKCF